MIGESLGPYRVLEKLGEGGMGQVYRARDPRLQREVALKILPAVLSSDPIHIERFRREARAVAALTHPNIVTIYSVEEADGVHFLTMELIEGRPLDRELSAAGCALAQLLDIGMALADGLAAAHERGIVHRDLKPANVMIDRHGRVKILDFGLAKNTTTDVALAETRAPLTNAGLVVGTMPYMAPEQIEGRTVDTRTDIFALGIVLYELAAGTRPFAGDSSPMLMTAILRDEPQPIAERRPDLPAAFGRVVSRCLEKRPNDRIQTARDVFNELRTVQRDTSAAPQAPAVATSGVASSRPAPGSGAERATGLWTAVLPFTARGGDADTIALAEGLTEDVAAGLIKFPYLKIVAASGSERPANARYVVQGSLRRAGSMLRVAVELIDTQSGVHLWADRFDREFTSSRIFEIQDDVAARIVVNVGDNNGALVRAMAATVHDRELSSLTVDELIWRGFATEHRGDPDEHVRVIAALEPALARDSAHAEGWASLAQLYGRAHLNPTTGIVDPVARQHAAARRAIDVDSTNQRGWCELAAAAFFNRDAAAFRSAADRALALNPLNANVVAFLSHLIAYAGEWQRGSEMLARTMALTGQHPGWYYFMPFVNHFRLGEYEQAWAVVKRINMSEEYPWTLASLAMTAARLERWEEVRAPLATLRRVAPWFLDPHTATLSLQKLVWDEAIVEQQSAALREALEYESRGPVTTRPSSSPAHVTAQLKSIAVLPFANLSADPENEYFGDGLAEDILNALTGVQGLNVIARTSAFAFKGKSDDVRKIGETLGVGTVLEGSVRRSGARVRVTAQLVDTRSGTHLWSQRYDRDITDIFAVQDDIAQAIVGTLKVTLTGAAPAVHTSANVDAYDSYLKGRHQLLTLTYSGVVSAQQLFARAIAIDPGFAPAHADLAGCFVHYTEQGRKPPREAMPLAREHARRAISLDPTSPDGHHWLARVAAEYDYDWPTALAHYEKAVASGRLSPSARAALAQFVLMPLDRNDDAERESEAAVAADPLSPIPRIHLSNLYRARGDFERALVVVDPGVVGTVQTMSRALTYSMMGRWKDAIELFNRAFSSTAVPFIAIGALAANLTRAHEDARARETLARLDTPEFALTRAVGYACYHIVREEFDEAVEHLLQAAAERQPWTPVMMTFNPRFRQSAVARRILDALAIPGRLPSS
jgi:TolB-like protein